MMNDFLSVEGPVFGFLDKMGQLIILSVLWISGCLPVITIGTSTAALYYTVVKTVRRERGSAVKEFWSSYKRNLARGIQVTVPTLLVGALLAFNIGLLQESGGGLYAGSVMLALLLGACWMYIGPVLSRFSMGTWEAAKLSFVAALNGLPFTLLLMIGVSAMALLQIYVLPAPMVLLMPGVWCYAASFLIEKVLRRYMPEKNECEDTWYYES